jgi:hypothetical protein
MKIASILAPVALALCAPAIAQPAAAPAAKFTLDTPIEQIIADPAGKAALDAALPGVSTHQALDMFKAMGLRQLAPYSEGMLTDERLAKAEAALATVK